MVNSTSTRRRAGEHPSKLTIVCNMAEIPKASLLKDEGNTLFSKKNYGAAYEKYTEAIEEDRNNAILYANRAACSLNLKR